MSVISSYHHGSLETKLSLVHYAHLDMTQGAGFPLEKIIGVKRCESVLRIPGTQWAWWPMPIIPELRKLRQEDLKLDIRVGYIVKLCRETKQILGNV